MNCKNLLLVTLAVLAGSLVWLVVQIPKAVAARADAAGAKFDAYAKSIGERLDQRDAQIADVLAEVQTYVRATSDDAYASAQTVTVILRDIAEATHTINTRILPEVSSLLAAIRESLSIVDAMRADMAQLTANTDADLKALRPVLDNTATLLTSLDQAVKTNSPEVQKIADALAKAITDLDEKLNDPNVAATMGHVEKISGSTEVIMQRMAQRAGRLKTILNTLIGAVKINFLGPQVF